MKGNHKCDECLYEYLSECEHPCNVCRWKVKERGLAFFGKLSYFEPKEKEHSSNCTISCKEGNKDFANEDYGFKEISKDEVDMVNHPQHYSAHGIEPIDYIESHDLNFNLGNVIKYVSRAPYKGTELQDLKKAKWYLEREINKHDK
jgi:hypothetical protein